MMGLSNVESTDPSLLRRIGDWRDDSAWCEFFRRYDPLMRGWCRRFGLDVSQAEDFLQQVWIDLSARMATFRFDPGKRFRSWLWTFFRHRVFDRRRLERDQPPTCPLDEASLLAAVPDDPSAAPLLGGDPPDLLALAEEVQAAVRKKVHPTTWRAFWLIAVEGRTVREVADELGMKYAAVYVAHRRVAERLGDEGRRLGASLITGS